MRRVFDEFVMSVRREARKRKTITVSSMGRERVFDGFDWGEDTFVFEQGAMTVQGGHQPILVVRKSDLSEKMSGYVMTVTSGNHAVAALPLLRGQFWSWGGVPAARQNLVLAERVLCANLVDGKVEISQREVPTGLLVLADEWMQGLGLPMDALVILERNPVTLEHFQKLGQEWRVRPLARTVQEMEMALRASRKRINSSLRYYHSARGVHFLSYAEFHALVELSRKDFDACVGALREMVSTFDGQAVPLRMDKFLWHHEIELFGLRLGAALANGGFVPELEKLMGDIMVNRTSQKDARRRLQGLDASFKASLERPELADETSEDFIRTLYRHLTGAVYEGEPGAAPLAFNDQRTALPGATYSGGRPAFHPGADTRTRTLLGNLEKLLVSQNETIEYANVHELWASEDVRLGEGVTRQVEFKTNRRPLCTSRIEKRLKLRRRGYGSYLLARVHAFQALGVNLGEYRLLMREEKGPGQEVNHFLRSLSPGYPLDRIPMTMFKDALNKHADPEFLRAMAVLLGDAAAQNLVMKKYVTEEQSCRFGVGKEIFEFEYKFEWNREMPTRVEMCSVRGALGWPDFSQTEENLTRVFDFYLSRYAQVLVQFWRKHCDALAHKSSRNKPPDTLKQETFESLVKCFLEGFDHKTRAMRWAYKRRETHFDAFDPKVLPNFAFKKRWAFALWALDCQEKRLDHLKEMFTKKSAKEVV